MKSDSLRWKEVSIPEHLEDYEGFYGLEEVEDVEVTRDPETGYISFNSRASTASNTNGTQNLSAEVGESEDDDWSGFEDEDEDRKQRTNQPEQRQQPKPKALEKDSTFPTLIDHNENDEVDVSAWKPLSLSPDTLSALSKLRFSKPTAIQQSAIPEILKGHDVIGKAATGSGKTLTFGIPILEYFLESRSSKRTAGREKSPLALILSPTRELAHQLEKHLTGLCSNGLFQGPAIATLTGGLSVQKQQRLLKTADIVVGTPGRLWEVISEGHGTIESLRRIKFLVVDEADRLLSQGHFKEMEEILNALDRKDEDIEQPEKNEPIERQTLVFSATFDRDLQRRLASKASKSSNHGGNGIANNKESMEYLLTKLNFRSQKPTFIDADPTSHLATGLKESLVQCPAGTDKDLYLYTLLLLLSNTRNNPRTLIFANSISAVKRLTPFLQNLNLPALALHSNMPQKARLRSVERFTTRANCSILVATDVAARGLDIPEVQIVIHYHLPRAADMYVHRSGRTARAGQEGSSILICAPEEVAGVRRLIAKVHASQDNNAEKQGHYIRTLDLDRRIVSRLKPRATLAKKLADVTVAKEKSNKEDEFLRNAAEELGVEYDSETFEKEASKGRRGRGSARKEKEREAKGMSKAGIGALKAELKGLLAQRVNVGVSERYIARGNVDMEEVLRQQEEANADGRGSRVKGREFLGSVHGLGLEHI